VFDGVLGTGVEELLGVDHAGQGPGIGYSAGNVYDGTDVDAAVADKHTHFGCFPADIAFRRIDLGSNQLVTSVSQESTCNSGSSAGVHHGLGNISGTLESSRHENARSGCLNRVQRVGMGKAVFIQVYPRNTGQFPSSLRRFNPHGQDHQFELFLHDFTVLEVFNDQVAAHGIFLDAGDHGAHITHPVFLG